MSSNLHHGERSLVKDTRNTKDAQLKTEGALGTVVHWPIARNKASITRDPVRLFDNTPADTSPVFELLTIDQVAGILQISATSVRRSQQKREIPFIKVGGSVRFAKSDLAAYLQKRRVESVG